MHFLKKDDILLKLAELKIANKIIERKSSVKFLGVMLDEIILRKIHMHRIEKNIKNIGLLNRANRYLNQTSLQTNYF